MVSKNNQQVFGVLNIRYFELQKAGLNCARNFGVRKSKTEIIDFIDDAVPDSKWTNELY
jgi:hypothetical protein